jgi:hypothetical protein
LFDIEKSNSAFTVSDNGCVSVTPPPPAPIITILVPNVAELVAENETVAVQVGLHGLFEKEAVMPVGKLDVTEKVTGWVVAPVISVAVIKEAPLELPCITVRLPGEGVDKVKKLTVNVNRVV